MLLQRQFLWQLKPGSGSIQPQHIQVLELLGDILCRFPIVWASKLQSQVALSMTESEYIALSMSLQDVLPIMFLLNEMKERDFQVICTAPHVYCKVFDDNSGALELARLPKLRPPTKHINVCYHHFNKHVCSRKVKIFPIGTKKQIADTLTKALPQNSFWQHRRAMCGQ